MGKFAQDTTVSVDSSQAEIRRLITRYGGDLPSIGWKDEQTQIVGFRWRGRFFKMEVRLPELSEFATAGNRRRTPAQAQTVREAEIRRRWRVLVIRMKAKFETVDSEPDTFDEEWMPFLLLPSGETVANWIQPQIEEAYLTGQMPARLMLLPAPKE